MAEITLNEIVDLAEDSGAFMEWLDEQGFIHIKDRFCNLCKARLMLYHRQGATDGVSLRCPKRGCNGEISVRMGTCFEHVDVRIRDYLRLVLMYEQEYSITRAADAVKMHRNTVSRYFSHFSNLITQHMQQHPVAFATFDIYEADEVCIKHVKLSDGAYASQVWIVGVLQRSTGRLRMEIVADRSAPTLGAFIRMHVPAGSVVCTDGWLGHSDVGADYEHHSVNHSEDEYVRVDNSAAFGTVVVHTNTLEGYWKHLRGSVANKTLRTMKHLSTCITTAMFRKSNRSLLNLVKVDHP
jgi:AraC-like DNA-binding protein